MYVSCVDRKVAEDSGVSSAGHVDVNRVSYVVHGVSSAECLVKLFFVCLEANHPTSRKKIVTRMHVDKPVCPVYIQIIKPTHCT